ncbi:MAG: hypothetical protein ACRDZ9_02475 [Acidimicrobiales bacterium]
MVRAFARGQEAGWSTRFHVEDPVLVTGGDVSAALRIGPSTVLVRADLPDEVRGAKVAVEAGLEDEGLTMFDPETPLAVPVALQLAGLRLSSWDLWGADIDQAFAALRAGAVGE